MSYEFEYYPNRQIKHEISLNPQGQKHGPSKGYYRDGKKEYEFPYQDGKIHGVVKYWGHSGRLWDEIYYLRGLRVSKRKYEAAQ